MPVDVFKVFRISVRLRHKVTQLKQLAEINIALNSTLYLNQLIKLVIHIAAESLNCEAVSILLYDEKNSNLYFSESSGADLEKLAEIQVPLEGSLAGTIFLENKPLIINVVGQDPRHYALAAKHVGFETRSLLGVPMRIRDRVTGVLEALNKKEGRFTKADQDILFVIASQAAVALQNARLMKDLQEAYSTTLEGWSKALDLRDKETEGHSLRVTELTLRLARAMGLGKEQLTFIRQGALLHDIGKMGVPDSILLKPGPLTEPELEIMHRHPRYAYELLSPIAYLQPALDIPYCHHERWDGSGYPRGLKGNEIPLAARIFTVIDVWDALCFERPYRRAWPEEKIISYLRDQSGKIFDPQVVEAFLRLIRPSP